MKTKKELEKLSNAIAKAERAYYNAIKENLKESGKEHIVESDNEDDDEEGLRVRTTDRHGNNVIAVIDKIRFNANCGVDGLVKVHVCKWNYNDKDYWIDIQMFDDDVKPYVYENIIW